MNFNTLTPGQLVPGCYILPGPMLFNHIAEQTEGTRMKTHLDSIRHALDEHRDFLERQKSLEAHYPKDLAANLKFSAKLSVLSEIGETAALGLRDMRRDRVNIDAVDAAIAAIITMVETPPD